ncbi:unnamed protein product [Cyclocybe aegerita]|uniref:PXA domain-containing protein n=1 Tax=Cyclocybe aegerita TaxID=1973307 RepID=A0A8S0X489_CYCAE|nr:unnamed protein product [Cyclocybe aegerita]
MSPPVVVVIRALDQRIQALDLPSLVFHDAPAILTQHYHDYRNAAAKASTSYATGGAASLPVLFAHLQPHMAISPDGVLDPEYYRTIVDHILKACLPPEDYEPEAERIIVREIIVKVLLNDLIPRITQPWFIHKAILDLIGPQETPIYKSQPVTPAASSQPFSFHNIIVIVLSALQSFSGMCLAIIHAYKQAITTIKLVQQSPPRSPQPPTLAVPTPTHLPPELLAPALASKPSQSRHTPSLSNAPSTTSTSSLPSSFSTAASAVPVQPSYLTSISHSAELTDHNYPAPLLALLSEIICATDRFTATVLFTTLSMLAACFTSFLDKLLPHMLFNFLSPAFVFNITRTGKRTLFPNGYPGPPPIDPSPEEQAEIRARLLAWRGKAGLALVLPLLVGPDPSQTIAQALEPLSNAQCNRHLIVFLLDRILIGLFPELGGAAMSS